MLKRARSLFSCLIEPAIATRRRSRSALASAGAIVRWTTSVGGSWLPKTEPIATPGETGVPRKRCSGFPVAPLLRRIRWCWGAGGAVGPGMLRLSYKRFGRVAETVLLRSDTGQELAADPMRIRLPDSPTLKATSSRPVDELRYDEAERAAAMRRRDLLLGLANRPRTTAEVTATAEALGLTPRGVWALLQRMASAGTESRSSCRPVTPLARRVPNARAEAITQQAIDQHFARRTRASQQSRRRDRWALPGRRLCGTVC